jgi:hypothetical protein
MKAECGRDWHEVHEGRVRAIRVWSSCPSMILRQPQATYAFSPQRGEACRPTAPAVGVSVRGETGESRRDDTFSSSAQPTQQAQPYRRVIHSTRCAQHPPRFGIGISVCFNWDLEFGIWNFIAHSPFQFPHLHPPLSPPAAHKKYFRNSPANALDPPGTFFYFPASRLNVRRRKSL